jgi:hypothetical protein
MAIEDCNCPWRCPLHPKEPVGQVVETDAETGTVKVKFRTWACSHCGKEWPVVSVPVWCTCGRRTDAAPAERALEPVPQAEFQRLVLQTLLAMNLGNAEVRCQDIADMIADMEGRRRGGA